jgi:Ala-tRNA(Pro) deacylase
LKSQNVNFRTVEHQAEGRCDVISKIRGNDLCQALKALVIMAKLNKKDRKYFLAVVPGDKSLDMTAIKDYSQAHDGVMFAPIDRASALTECNIGAVPPFTFNQDLHLIVDPSIKLNKEVVFNAGVLDHSIFISIEDYIKTANPTFVDIIKK